MELDRHRRYGFRPPPGSEREKLLLAEVGPHGFEAIVHGVPLWWPHGHPRPFEREASPSPFLMGWRRVRDEVRRGDRYDVAYLTCELERGFLAPSPTLTPREEAASERAADLMPFETLDEYDDEALEFYEDLFGLDETSSVDKNYWYVMRRWSGPRAVPQPRTATALAVEAWSALFETCGGRSSALDADSGEPREHSDDAQRPSRAPDTEAMER